MFRSFVKKMFSSKPNAPIVRPAKKASLLIESLEDRTVPTTLTVGLGYQFSSIASALSAATSNAIIDVYSGTYTQPLTIAQNGIQLIAETSSVLIQPTNATATTLGQAAINVTGSNVVISGLTVDGSKDTNGNLYADIRVVNGGSATISNDTIEGMVNGNSTFDVGVQVGTSSVGAYGANSAGAALIHNDVIETYRGAGIVVDGGSGYANIQLNTIAGQGTANKQVSEYGVQVSNGATARVQGNTITGNTIYGSAGAPNNPTPTSAGIFFYNDGDKASVAALNYVSGNDDGILVQNSNGQNCNAIQVVNNSVTGNYGYAGIFVLSSNNIQVAANYVVGNTTYNGIALNYSSNVVVHSNDVGNNGTASSQSDGIFDTNGSNNQIVANYAFDNTGNGININYTSGDSLFNNVTVSNTLSGIQDISGTNDTIWLGDSDTNLQNGIYLIGTNGDTIVGNVIAFNGNWGIYLQGAKNTFIANNLVVGNGQNGQGGSIYVDSASTGTTLINNWTSSPPVKDGTTGATGSSNACSSAHSDADSATSGLCW